MFGLIKRKQKEKSNSLTVFKKFFDLCKEGKNIEGKTIEGWNVYPELSGGQLTSRKGRAEIRLYFTDKTMLTLNTSDCDIEINISNIEL